MAKSRKRGEYWSARWIYADGTDGEQGGFLTEDDADIYAAEQKIAERKKRKEGNFDKRNRKELTLFQYVDEIYSATIDVKSRTASDYEINLNTHIIPKFGDYGLSQITASEIEIWRKELKNKRQKNGKRYSLTTLEKLENQLATILKKAHRDGHLLDNPFLRVSRARRRKAKHREVHPLEFEVVEGIANSILPHLKLLPWLGYFSGMRPSEMLGLTWDRIDFSKKTIRIDRQLHYDSNEIFDNDLKSDASYRTINLPKPLESMLIEHRAKFGLGPEQLLFHNRDKGVLRYKAALDAFVKVARPLGVPVGTGLHVFRHTCVSNLIRMGAQPKQIQMYVGHNSIEETMNTYGHLFEDDMEKLGTKLEDSYLERKLAKRQSFEKLA
jgi:integrase